MTNYLIKGLPKIGKSLKVEEYIQENYTGSLYIGTLWHNNKTEETIKNHSDRRDKSFWELFEVGFDPLLNTPNDCYM